MVTPSHHARPATLQPVAAVALAGTLFIGFVAAVAWEAAVVAGALQLMFGVGLWAWGATPAAAPRLHDPAGSLLAELPLATARPLASRLEQLNTQLQELRLAVFRDRLTHADRDAPATLARALSVKEGELADLREWIRELHALSVVERTLARADRPIAVEVWEAQTRAVLEVDQPTRPRQIT